MSGWVGCKMMANFDVALDTHVREELGLNPEELGSAWGLH